jgi:hypothetical protein
MPPPLQLPPITNDRSALAWEMWCDFMGIPQPVGRRVWAAMGKSQHSSYVTLRFQLSQLLKCPPALRRQRVWRLHEGLLAPKTLLPLVDNLVQAGWVRRDDLTVICDRLLPHTDAAGRWAWLPHKQGGSHGS